MVIAMTKEEIIEKLALALHPSEGGYFKRTYESAENVIREGSSRKLLTSIYYMLTSDSPIGYLHRNKSDIIHYYHLGAPIKYVLITSDGKVEEKVLGANIDKGELPQLIVRGGVWKASHLCSGEYGLISEAVSPGFDYKDNEIANPDVLSLVNQKLVSRLDRYIKREKT